MFSYKNTKNMYYFTQITSRVLTRLNKQKCYLTQVVRTYSVALIITINVDDRHKYFVIQMKY